MMGDDKNDGFELPIHRALTESILIMGVPKNLFYANIFLGVLLFFVLGVWQIVLLNFIIHFVSVFLTKKDTQFMGVFLRYCKKKAYYHT